MAWAEKYFGDCVWDHVRSGHYIHCLDSVKLALCNLATAHCEMKVGITDHPERRWEQHQRDKPGHWWCMVVLYETGVYDLAQKMEEDLIAWSRRGPPHPQLVNVAPGKEGRIPASGERAFRVYVLLAP